MQHTRRTSREVALILSTTHAVSLSTNASYTCGCVPLMATPTLLLLTHGGCMWMNTTWLHTHTMWLVYYNVAVYTWCSNKVCAIIVTFRTHTHASMTDTLALIGTLCYVIPCLASYFNSIKCLAVLNKTMRSWVIKHVNVCMSDS